MLWVNIETLQSLESKLIIHELFVHETSYITIIVHMMSPLKPSNFKYKFIFFYFFAYADYAI